MSSHTNLRKSESDESPGPCSARNSLSFETTSATNVGGASAESASNARSFDLNFTLPPRETDERDDGMMGM